MCVSLSTAPLCPSSLAWLLSCGERFLLVFGIHGNASFHEELSVCDDQELLPFLSSFLSLSPTRSLLFPFPLHYALLCHLPRSFLPLAYISYTSPRYPQHLPLSCSFRSPCTFHIFSAFSSTDLLLCELSLHVFRVSISVSIIPYVFWMNSFHTFTSWAITAELYWVSQSWLIHQCVFVSLCSLSPAELWLLLKWQYNQTLQVQQESGRFRLHLECVYTY